MSLTLRQIDAFRAVMVAGTLTEAANQLGISQPAISRLIADMEADIGYQLFERVGRRISPTAEAEILIDEVKRALIGMVQIREAALEIGRFRYSRLRLLTIPGIPSSLVTRLVSDFSRQYPDAFVSIEVKQPELVVECLTTHQCDIALVSGLPESGGCLSQKLADSPVHCILPNGHVLADREVITPEDLAQQVFISLRPDNALRTAIDALFEKRNVARVLRYEARTPDMICSMVGSGLGVSLASLVHLGLFQDQGRILLRPFQPSATVELSLIWSRHRQLPAMAHAFMTTAEQCLKGA